GANRGAENEICHVEQSRDIPRSDRKHYATGFLDFARNDRCELAAEMITAPLLEIAVLVLGMLILMVEAFAGKIDKRVLAFAAITGLVIVLLASFFVVPSPSPGHATGFWNFYTADRLAIFFKQFALLTTIFVLIMVLDYVPVMRSSFPGAAAQAGLGEFVAVPLFACAGLMYLVSAIDFVFI